MPQALRRGNHMISLRHIMAFGGAAADEAADKADQSMAAHFPKIYSRAAHDQLTGEKDKLGMQLNELKGRLREENQKVVTMTSTLAEINVALGEGGAFSKATYDAAPEDKKPQIMAKAT